MTGWAARRKPCSQRRRTAAGLVSRGVLLATFSSDSCCAALAPAASGLLACIGGEKSAAFVSGRSSTQDAPQTANGLLSRVAKKEGAAKIGVVLRRKPNHTWVGGALTCAPRSSFAAVASTAAATAFALFRLLVLLPPPRPMAAAGGAGSAAAPPVRSQEPPASPTMSPAATAMGGGGQDSRSRDAPSGASRRESVI